MKICYIPYDKTKKCYEFDTRYMYSHLYSFSVIPEMYALSKFCSFFGNNIDFWLCLSGLGTIGCSIYWVKNVINSKIDEKCKRQQEYYQLLNEFNQVSLNEKKLKLEGLSNVDASKNTNIVYDSSEIKNMFY